MSKPSAPVDPLVEFGRRVRAARLERGWTLEDLAEASGLHWTYVGQIERGQRNVTLKNILKTAAALDIEPGVLMNGLSLPAE